MRVRQFCVALVCVLTPVLNANAAGTFEPVKVRLFQPGKQGQHAMIVVPTDKGASTPKVDSLRSLCKELRVFGSFDQPHWAKNTMVTAVGHAESMALLQRAYQNKTMVNFGELGSGFRVTNKTMPCTVKSRGLIFWKDADTTAALSIFHAF